MRSKRATLQCAILVVDDEEAVRALVETCLEAEGYRVLLAPNGRAAIDVFRRNPDAIDLTILDLSMPELSGEETLRELRTIRPDARVVVTSGYAEPHVLHRFSGDAVQAFLYKPFSPALALERVRGVLEGQAGSTVA